MASTGAWSQTQLFFCKNWPQLNDLKRSVQQYCTIVHATRSCFIVPYSTCIWQVKWRETVFNTRFDETICVLTTSAYRNAIVWLSFVILMGLIRISSAITIHEMLWFVYSTFSNIIFRNSFWTRFFSFLKSRTYALKLNINEIKSSATFFCSHVEWKICLEKKYAFHLNLLWRSHSELSKFHCVSICFKCTRLLLRNATVLFILVYFYLLLMTSSKPFAIACRALAL